MPQLLESKMATCSVRYEPHLSDKARSEASRFSITKNGMPIHWWSYSHCLFVSYLISVTFGYGWVSDTTFQKFSDEDYISMFTKFIEYGSGVKKSISAHLLCMCTWCEVRNFAWYRSGFINFATRMESESEKVTEATSAVHNWPPEVIMDLEC